MFAQALLLLIFGGLPHNLPATVAVEIVLLLAGALISLLLVMVAFRSAFLKVIEISRTAHNRAQTFVLVRHYLTTSLGVMQEQLKALHGEGLSLAIAEMDEVAGWIPTFFSSAKGKYVGFDSSVPSYYLKRWEGYIRHLQSHEPGVRLRVITSPRQDLLDDIQEHPESARNLQEIHDDLHADLVCLDQAAVEKLAEKHKLPSSSVVSLALWEEDYCLFWEQGKERFTVRLALADGSHFPKLLDFITEVEAQAVPLRSLLPAHEQATLVDPDSISS